MFLEGSSKDSKSDRFQLHLPLAKQAMHLPTSEPERSAEKARRSHLIDDKRSGNRLIEFAVHQGKQKTWSSHYHAPPKRKCEGCSCTPVDMPGALNYILNQHPFPLNQGPLLLPLDDHIKKEKVSVCLSKTSNKVAKTFQCRNRAIYSYDKST